MVRNDIFISCLLTWLWFSFNFSTVIFAEAGRVGSLRKLRINPFHQYDRAPMSSNQQLQLSIPYGTNWRPGRYQPLPREDDDWLKKWSYIGHPARNMTQEETILPETITTPYPKQDNLAVIGATIFAALAILAFFVALCVVIIKLRKPLKRTIMSVGVVRDLRDISEFERERERQRRRAAVLVHQLQVNAAEYSERAYLEQLQTLFPFQFVLREDLDLENVISQQALQLPPSYETLFENQDTTTLNKLSISDNINSDDEPPPPRYSACFCSESENVNFRDT